MCTGLRTFNYGNLLFGRNLDYEFSFKEDIVIVPRKFNLKYRFISSNQNHFAFLGVAHIEDGYPLFYDGMNEKGLCIAGLNFVGNTFYNKKIKENCINLAQFEFIPYILSKYESIKDLLNDINNINVTNTSFSSLLPCAELHYLLSDKDRCIVLEFSKEGLNIYENNVGVLTNNPSFDIQLFNLNNYSSLSNKNPVHSFPLANLKDYSRGMGSIGLPGDPSSMGRFVKASFVLNNSLFYKDEHIRNINQFFHCLTSIEQQVGVAEVNDGKFEYTIYANCYSSFDLTMYYKCYSNNQINAVSLNKVDLNISSLLIYSMKEKENIFYQNY